MEKPKQTPEQRAMQRRAHKILDEQRRMILAMEMELIEDIDRLVEDDLDSNSRKLSLTILRGICAK